MRQGIRRLFVLTIALAFIGRGFGRAAFSATADEPCHPGAHQPAAHDHAHGAHAEHAMHHAHHDDGAAKKSSTDQACFKCCGICTVGSTLTPLTDAAGVVFAATRIVYSIDGESHRDRPVVLDPGIPKRTA
jgi:hypothetical protein